MPILCEVCGKEIPVERLVVLPETKTCVACSDVEPRDEDSPGVIPIADTEELYKETR